MAVIGAAISAIGGWLASGSIMASLVVNLMTTTAASALTAAMNKPKGRQPGIKTEYTTEGGTVAQSFLLGWYATNGHMVCPPITHGKAGKTPNAYLTYVISLSNVPGQQIDKLIIDDNEIEFETEEETMPIGGTVPFGKPLWWYTQQGLNPADPNASLPKITPGRPGKGKYAGKIWLRYYDGTQTAADPYLRTIAGPGTDWAEGSKRPWGADMVGVDTCYAVITFRFWRNVFPGLPRCRFVMTGVPLYDPRKDSSVGGDGAQRWNAPLTWVPSNNALVQAYNVLRGIPINGGPLWGYGVEGEDLPLSAWIPAMNAADLDEGGKPRWQSGLEVSVDEEPADILDEIGKVSCTAFAEIGGVWKPRVGPPAAPVYFFTDDDILLDHEATATPFPAIDDTYNGVHASYPDPKQFWQPKDAPPRYNADWEASDNSRRRVADLSLAACPYPDQAQRVMRGYIEEERRFRRHVLTLPPEASVLEPLDAISWTSAEHGYLGKIFEVVESIVHPDTLAVTVSLRERDSADYDWRPDFVLPSTPASVLVPAVPAVTPEFFTAEGIAILDAGGQPRRAAARLRWGGWALEGVRQVLWEMRLIGSDNVIRGAVSDPESGEMVTAEGILPATSYQARIQFLKAGELSDAWTAWAPFVTPDVRIGARDLEVEAIKDQVRDGMVSYEAWADGTGEHVRGLVDAVEDIRDRMLEVDLGTFTARQVQKAQLTAEINGARAELTQQLAAAVSETEAVAQSVTQLQVQLGGKASSSALDALTVRVVKTEDGLKATASDITALESTIAGKANATAVNALTTRVSDVEGVAAAQSEAITLVEAKTDRGSASGLLRIAAESSPAGVQTRIGIRAEATAADNTHSAAMYLEAKTDGTSQVIVAANRFAIATSNGPAASRLVPFIVDSGVVYMDTAVIKDLSVDRLKIANGAVTMQHQMHIDTTDPDPSFTFNMAAGGAALIGFSGEVSVVAGRWQRCSLSLNGDVVRWGNLLRPIDSFNVPSNMIPATFLGQKTGLSAGSYSISLSYGGGVGSGGRIAGTFFALAAYK